MSVSLSLSLALSMNSNMPHRTHIYTNIYTNTDSIHSMYIEAFADGNVTSRLYSMLLLLLYHFNNFPVNFCYAQSPLFVTLNFHSTHGTRHWVHLVLFLFCIFISDFYQTLTKIIMVLFDGNA